MVMQWKSDLVCLHRTSSHMLRICAISSFFSAQVLEQKNGCILLYLLNLMQTFMLNCLWALGVIVYESKIHSPD